MTKVSNQNKSPISLIPKILRFKHAATSSLEVYMLDDSFILASINGILYLKKIESFAFEKICTRKKSSLQFAKSSIRERTRKIRKTIFEKVSTCEN